MIFLYKKSLVLGLFVTLFTLCFLVSNVAAHEGIKLSVTQGSNALGNSCDVTAIVNDAEHNPSQTSK
jgi:hypothetical protein